MSEEEWLWQRWLQAASAADRDDDPAVEAAAHAAYRDWSRTAYGRETGAPRREAVTRRERRIARRRRRRFGRS